MGRIDGYIGIMEKKMEATITGYIGIIGYTLGLYRDNGKENGSYHSRTEILKVDTRPAIVTTRIIIVVMFKSSDIPIIRLL